MFVIGLTLQTLRRLELRQRMKIINARLAYVKKNLVQQWNASCKAHYFDGVNPNLDIVLCKHSWRSMSCSRIFSASMILRVRMSWILLDPE
mgnify:CR=1 FL=1